MIYCTPLSILGERFKWSMGVGYYCGRVVHAMFSTIARVMLMCVIIIGYSDGEYRFLAIGQVR